MAMTNGLPPAFLLEEGADPFAGDGPEVARNLSRLRKQIDAKYVYDERGTWLFEQQCATEEYYLRRAEAGLLLRHARDITEVCGPVPIVELGAGTGEKTAILLAEYGRRGVACDYYPIDVDAGTLRSTSGRLAARFPGLAVRALAATYERGLEHLQEIAHPRLCLFLGSSLGNLSTTEMERLLSELWRRGARDDFLLVGVDLHKDAAVIDRAYNDAAGFGARSTLNMLDHLNWRYCGNFVADRFDYRSRYDPDLRRNEVSLVSRVAQVVTLDGLSLSVSFDAQEAIDAEVMWKFDEGQWTHLLERAGWVVVQRWLDLHHAYALLLLRHR